MAELAGSRIPGNLAVELIDMEALKLMFSRPPG